MIDDKTRLEIETLVYSTFDAADKTGTNTEYYKNLLSKMSNSEFDLFIRKKFPFRLHTEPFKVEPNMKDAFDAFKVINKPLLETIKLPYLYKNEKGESIETKEALVVYINMKRMKQLLTKKNSTAIDIAQRDMRTGLLLKEDKGGKNSNKEFESGAALSWDYTIDEFSRIRADAMDAKTRAYNQISTSGSAKIEDIPVDKTDSLAKRMLNVYLMGANLHSNLIDSGYYTPHTLERRRKVIQRSNI